MAEGNRDVTVRLLNGLPSFRAQCALESEMLLEAGLANSESFLRERPSPTSMHVVSVGSTPVAVAVVTIGPLRELPLGRLLADHDVEVGDHDPLPGPVAELVSLSSDRSAHAEGVTELLYRSFYQQAVRAGVQSLAVGMDPWVFDLLTEQYGAPFEILGPIVDTLGRVMLPAGARLEELEAGVATNAPEFLAFLRSGDEHDSGTTRSA